MLQMRARGFAVRDAFPDVLRGLITAEEAADIPVRDTFAGPTIEHATPVAPEPAVGAAQTKRQTSAEWLDEIDMEVAAARTADEVDEIEARPKVQKMLDWLQNGARDRLQHILRVARERTADEAAVPDAGVFADPSTDPFRQPVTA